MILKQSTAYTRKFLMVSTSDHVTGLIGQNGSLVVQLSKGPQTGSTVAVFANASGATQEIGFGWYQVDLTQADTGTAGDLAFHCTASGGDPTDFCDQVQPQIFTDLQLDGTGNIKVASNLKQNQSFSVPFLMTNANTNVPAAGLTVTGQRVFGAGGFSPISGTIAEVGGAGNGGGWYVFTGLASDSNNAVAGFKMTAAGANDTDFTLWFSP